MVGKKVIKMSLADHKKKDSSVSSVDSELSTRDAPADISRPDSGKNGQKIFDRFCPFDMIVF